MFNRKLLHGTEADRMFLLNKKIITPADRPFGTGDGGSESACRDAAQPLSCLTGNFSTGQRQTGCSCETKKMITPADRPFGTGGAYKRDLRAVLHLRGNGKPQGKIRDPLFLYQKKQAGVLRAGAFFSAYKTCGLSDSHAACRDVCGPCVRFAPE